MKTTQYFLKKITFGILFFLGITVNGFAQVDSYFTTPNGAGDCSQVNPCALDTALVSAVDFDIIYLGEGNFTSSENQVAWLKNSISILGGWDGTNTSPVVRNPQVHVSIIDGEGHRRGILIDADKRVVLNGFTIARAFINTKNGAGLYVENSQSLNLENVIFSNNNIISSTFANGGAIYVDQGIVDIEKCIFTSNMARGIDGSSGGALYIKEANSTIRNSIFQDNISKNSTVLRARGIDTSNLSKLIFEANTVTNNGLTDSEYGVIDIRNGDIEIKNNTISNNKSTLGHLISIEDSKLLFKNNLLSKNINGQSTLFLQVYTFNLQIINNIIVDNNSTASDYPSIWFNDTQAFVYQNTIANNDADFAILIGDLELEDTNEVHLKNNIIVGHPVGIHAGAGTTVTLNSTLWYNNTQTEGEGTITENYNYQGDPDFKNVALGDYHIGSHSAAIDRGIITGIATDIDDENRPQGDGYDIGADEFVKNLTSPALIMYLLN